MLSAVATALSGHPTAVYCTPPPPARSWPLRQVGEAWLHTTPRRIYLRECRGLVRLRAEAGHTFSHEILHVRHPLWPERRVLAAEEWYWRARARPYLAHSLRQ